MPSNGLRSLSESGRSAAMSAAQSSALISDLTWLATSTSGMVSTHHGFSRVPVCQAAASGMAAGQRRYTRSAARYPVVPVSRASASTEHHQRRQEDDRGLGGGRCPADGRYGDHGNDRHGTGGYLSSGRLASVRLDDSHRS